MRAPPTIYRILLVVVVGVAAAASLVRPAFASESGHTADPINQVNAEYISGGIGSDEEQEFKSEAKDYNLLISNATKEGSFVADIKFSVETKKGRELISANDAGPLFYAKLPPGEYTIKASSRNGERIQNVRISANKTTDVHLIWQPT